MKIFDLNVVINSLFLLESFLYLPATFYSSKSFYFSAILQLYPGDRIKTPKEDILSAYLDRLIRRVCDFISRNVVEPPGSNLNLLSLHPLSSRQDVTHHTKTQLIVQLSLACGARVNIKDLFELKNFFNFLNILVRFISSEQEVTESTMLALSLNEFAIQVLIEPMELSIERVPEMSHALHSKMTPGVGVEGSRPSESK